MSAAGPLLGAVVTLATGVCFVRALDSRNGPRHSIGWLTTLCLGFAVGIALASCTHFLWQEVHGEADASFVLVDLALLGLAFAAVGVRHARRTRAVDADDPAPSPSQESGRLFSILLCAAAIAAAANATLFMLQIETGSAAHWDAFAIWNLKARFLARSGSDWAAASDPALLGGHPDYPLLLPLTVARLWRWGGHERALVPAAIAGAFTGAVVLLLAGALADLKGRAQGALGALVLLALPQFFVLGAWQYADVPLAFFELSTLVCVMLSLRSEADSGRTSRGWVLAGLCAGAAAWTKNEGALFAVAASLAIAVASVADAGVARTGKRLAALALGLLAPLATLSAFELRHPFPNDLVSGLDGRALGRLLEPDRHLVVLRALAQHAWPPSNHLPSLLIAAYAVVAVVAVASGKARATLPAPPDRVATRSIALCLLLVVGGLYGTYLVTPYDVSWHVANSADRLVAQVLPSVLLWLFYVLPPAEVVLGERAP